VVTNTIGAKHGLGSATLPSNSASPLGVAGNGAVTRLTITAVPLSIDWQLTTARNAACGFRPVLVRTSPATSISRSPFALSFP
jgi:hypothetical protein